MNDDLTARLRQGDSAALEEAIDRYSVYAAKIIAAYGNRALLPEDLEEILSDVFVNLWNSRERLQGEIKPYLAAIARNAARQRLRQLHPTQALPENWEIMDPSPQPEQLAQDEERTAALRQAVDALPQEERTLFIRFYYLEQTVDEIAAVTGQNASTLRVRLHRGRKKLKEFLRNRGVCYDGAYNE